MSWLVVAPILIPFGTAIIGFLVGRSITAQRIVNIAGAIALPVVGIALLWRVSNDGILAVQMGNWPAPYGITLVADHLSAILVMAAGIAGLSVTVYALADIDRDRERYGFHPLLQVMLAGVCGAFLTGDLFNLYVWFEVMLIASFALLVLGGERRQIDGAVKYVALNLVSTVLFLSAVGLLYGVTGTLNMADLHGAVQQIQNQGLLAGIAVMFIVAFGIKSAVFPLFFWLPASYHTPPVAVTAIFAALLTKVGVYALIRTFTLIFTGDVGFTHTLLMWIAGTTLIAGVLGALAQNELRRLLSFSVIVAIGFMLMGLALFTPLGLIGAVFYLFHDIIVKVNLFMISGVANRLTGSFDLRRMGGLYKSAPLIAVIFIIAGFAFAGLPPFSGFWAKLILIRAGLEIGSYPIVAAALVTSILTVFLVGRVWAEAFWQPHPAGIEPATAALGAASRAVLIAPTAVLALLTVVIGLWAEPFVALATRAADELLNPDVYVRAVLGGVP